MRARWWLLGAGLGTGAVLLLSARQAAASTSTADGVVTSSNLIQEVLTLMGPRGIRNNNPGNIRHSSSQWQGMAEKQTDPEFVQFVRPEDGIRAIAVILQNYIRLYGRNTIRKMIIRWAPPNENNTEAYVQSVASYAGIDPDQVLTDNDMPRVVAGIIRQENGVQPYDVATIAQGVSLAGIALA